ncbi:hypothetical protein PR048_000647 [Dryococelus australis]|uniref:Uncharacterized protein n=1 Tax=Dryococelus australis TaxID=614101 RepID=A0ABQ9IF83_9NEOP|nr:hypothetical protein PR048_000647 [Dryococelus australis]
MQALWRHIDSEPTSHTALLMHCADTNPHQSSPILLTNAHQSSSIRTNLHQSPPVEQLKIDGRVGIGYGIGIVVMIAVLIVIVVMIVIVVLILIAVLNVIAMLIVIVMLWCGAVLIAIVVLSVVLIDRLRTGLDGKGAMERASSLILAEKALIPDRRSDPADLCGPSPTDTLAHCRSDHHTSRSRPPSPKSYVPIGSPTNDMQYMRSFRNSLAVREIHSCTAPVACTLAEPDYINFASYGSSPLNKTMAPFAIASRTVRPGTHGKLHGPGLSRLVLMIHGEALGVHTGTGRARHGARLKRARPGVRGRTSGVFRKLKLPTGTRLIRFIPTQCSNFLNGKYTGHTSATPEGPTVVVRLEHRHHTEAIRARNPSESLLIPACGRKRTADFAVGWRVFFGTLHFHFSFCTPQLLHIHPKFSPAGNKGRGKLEIPEKTRRPAASSGTIPICENSGGDPAGSEITEVTYIRIQCHIITATYFYG